MSHNGMLGRNITCNLWYTLWSAHRLFSMKPLCYTACCSLMLHWHLAGPWLYRVGIWNFHSTFITKIYLNVLNNFHEKRMSKFYLPNSNWPKSKVLQMCVNFSPFQGDPSYVHHAIGLSNRDHATSSKEGRSESFTT